MLQNISKELDYNNAEEVKNKNDFAEIAKKYSLSKT